MTWENAVRIPTGSIVTACALVAVLLVAGHVGRMAGADGGSATAPPLTRTAPPAVPAATTGNAFASRSLSTPRTAPTRAPPGRRIRRILARWLHG